MKKGEKILSFVKQEKELIEDYRKSLHDVKRSDEVGDVFIEFALKFLEKVLEDFKPEEYTEDIAFEPEKESYTLSERLKEKIGEDLLKKSDLPAILQRFCEMAAHRWKQLKADEEKTDFFKRPGHEIRRD
ncbi:MAG: Uncharacterized protein XD64_0868 [Thermotoga sp. 47_83]|jgi:hypothetical protein|uniref:hypothetical protein n=1 Tax=Thermotoga TaxID=2335 RepID=UPI0001600C0F|nr:hypothetical protein [Thermotoga sp. RQ2]ACB09792.1 conserved hypothetical protein [Thermotoga sp. RQ2]KUK33304.1 MAG: Uncharacterized protein XD64_0868 [Thermotoga sp. 47_83]MBZ4660857.1 hypothetical protein [Thermotoga sp.]HBF69838.1 hypothetical protein [Thermotoga sp.]